MDDLAALSARLSGNQGPAGTSGISPFDLRRNATHDTGRSIRWRADRLAIRIVYHSHHSGGGRGHRIKCRFSKDNRPCADNASRRARRVARRADQTRESPHPPLSGSKSGLASGLSWTWRIAKRQGATAKNSPANPYTSCTFAFTHLAILASGRRRLFLEPQSIFARSCQTDPAGENARTSLTSRVLRQKEEAYLEIGAAGWPRVIRLLNLRAPDDVVLKAVRRIVGRCIDSRGAWPSCRTSPHHSIVDESVVKETCQSHGRSTKCSGVLWM